METKWHILYIKPRYNEHISQVLTRKNITSYYASSKLSQVIRRNKYFVKEPVFPSYLFVKLSEADRQGILQIRGTINFVFWLQKPVVISDLEIQMMQQFLHTYTDVVIKKTVISANHSDQLTAGRKEHSTLIYIKNDIAKIVLASLGYILTADTSCLQAKVIKAKKISYSKLLLNRRLFNL